MYMQQYIVKCESGLYNRQATYFIQKANEFKSSIWVEVEDRAPLPAAPERPVDSP